MTKVNKLSTTIPKDSSVTVAVRVRPLIESDEATSRLPIKAINNKQISITAAEKSPPGIFTFDFAFGPETSQIEIFENSVSKLIDSLFEGINSSVIAYGQTGSGKSYTMGTTCDIKDVSNIGIIPRSIQAVFQRIGEKRYHNVKSKCKVSAQFIEVYGEEIRDLLNPSAAKISIRETPSGDLALVGASVEVANTQRQMLQFLQTGMLLRTTASTSMNIESSRSHAIFVLILEQSVAHDDESEVDNDNHENFNPNVRHKKKVVRKRLRETVNLIHGNVEIRTSKFYFVDLAGSERLKRTNAEGQRMKESIDINRGLLALGNVISALAEPQKSRGHIPYRDSKLTRILQDSLGGNSKSLFLCCVSPIYIDLMESLGALRYANRARRIQNKPVVNLDSRSAMIAEMQEIIKILATELLEVKKKGFIHDQNVKFQPFTKDELIELSTLNYTGNYKLQRLNSPQKIMSQAEHENQVSDLLQNFNPNEADLEDFTNSESLKPAKMIKEETKQNIVNSPKEGTLVLSKTKEFSVEIKSSLPVARLSTGSNNSTKHDRRVRRKSVRKSKSPGKKRFLSRFFSGICY